MYFGFRYTQIGGHYISEDPLISENTNITIQRLVLPTIPDLISWCRC